MFDRNPYIADFAPLLEAYTETFDLDEAATKALINQHSPKKRLEIYLQWNGIIGWTDSIFAIANSDSIGVRHD